MKNLAVLITCHNRVSATLASLEALYLSAKNINVDFNVFLVDDGSTDNTYEKVSERFPKVNIIRGSGNLFWNQGMRLAWSTACKNTDYDFYLLLNNDTFLNSDGLKIIFDNYFGYKNEFKKEAIVVGACSESSKCNVLSYGLRMMNEDIIYPNENFKCGDFMNGNCVLISRKIFKSTGLLSENYTHAMGDFDYGLRAIEAGFKLITTNCFVAVCKSNIKNFKDANFLNSISIRWQYLNSPLGLNISEYKTFRKRFWPKTYWIFIIKIYFRFLFPKLYNFLKNE